MEKYSFYYRDAFDLKKAFPCATSFSLTDPHSNIVLEDGVIRLESPEAIQPDMLHLHINVHFDNKQYKEVEVDIRCWRDNGPYLHEVTRFLWLKKLSYYQKICRVIKRIIHSGYNSILLTTDDVTYYTFGGFLCGRSGNKRRCFGRQVKLLRPEYNQMIKAGEYAFIRTGEKIFASTDNLRTWKVIHSGTHALRKSMIWDDETKSLVFSNYTGGDERVRHYLRRYSVKADKTDIILTFYTKDEHDRLGLTPFARHIHIISEDPYTGDWYIAVGDYEDEPAIYRSTDKGKTFEKVGGGEQTWRTLSFIFKKDYILWGSDSESPQYLSRINREQLKSLPIDDNDVKRYPLFNGALWFTYDDADITIMSSNSEGSFYDDRHRVYGITVDKYGEPTVFSLFEERSDPNKNHFVYNQLCFLEKDVKGRLWFYDYQNNINRQFIICR